MTLVTATMLIVIVPVDDFMCHSISCPEMAVDIKSVDLHEVLMGYVCHVQQRLPLMSMWEWSDSMRTIRGSEGCQMHSKELERC